MGDLDKSRDDFEQTRDIGRIEFNDTSDLAILFIGGPLNIGFKLPSNLDPVYPISLPTKRPILKRGSHITLTGWGSDSLEEPVLHLLRVKSMSVSECRGRQRGYFCSPQWAPGEPGLCSGYSGGPVFWYTNRCRLPELVGIAAGSTCNGQCQNPHCDNLFIDIWPHVSWIMATKWDITEDTN